MASRIYDIKLSCGCLISLDGGGGLIPCHDDENCRYEEEFIKNPKHKEWQQEIMRRNGWSEKEIKRKYGNKYIEIMNEPDYKKAFTEIMKYFDSIPDEEKEKLNEKLKECGV